MENNTFKSVAFGGFAKQDVINYIEEAAREAAAQQERLEQENESLRTQIQDLTAQLEQAQGKVQELNARREELERRWSPSSPRRSSCPRKMHVWKKNCRHCGLTQRHTPSSGNRSEPSSARHGSVPLIWRARPFPGWSGSLRISAASIRT